LDSVPVVIRHVDDTTARQIALIENLQREDISPLEEAQVLAQILNETGCSHRELGEKVGKSKTYIEQRVRLLRYPSDVQAALANPLTSFHPGHAKAVVQIGDAETRQLLIAEIQRQQLSVREAEHRVTRLRTRQLKTHRTRTTAATSVTLDNLAVVALLRPLLVSQATQVDTTALRKALQQDIRMLNAAPSDEN
jgi:ParB family chromosome partitioning protein